MKQSVYQGVEGSFRYSETKVLRVRLVFSEKDGRIAIRSASIGKIEDRFDGQCVKTHKLLTPFAITDGEEYKEVGSLLDIPKGKK